MRWLDWSPLPVVGWSSGEALEQRILANMAQTNNVSQNSNGEMDDSPNTLVYRKCLSEAETYDLWPGGQQ
ncbi:regulator of G-protein signaling 7-like [Clarias magur]|uniref:Regulator of G-protein signaling 7-like n=1 Tax=Clarias magur TaxID=1594786 RepID=A0A8J4WXA2_CLAMG|nr:regulator of G-protein signaling 7-like [Clarias magur]